jgi:hypothetical protein
MGQVEFHRKGVLAYDISAPDGRVAAASEPARPATDPTATALRRAAPPRPPQRPDLPHARTGFPTPEGYIVGLAYDPNAPFALNILAAGGGEMTRAGRQYQITRPRRVGREARDLLPAWAALMMRAVGIEDYLQFDATPLQDGQ